MLPVADAMPVPPTTPRVCAIARMPPTRPRRPTGTWSGIVAVTAASIAFRAAWTPHQPSAITTTLSATDSTPSDSAPPAAPPTTQGSRRPIRSVVRSEKAPNSGLQITEVNAPSPRTKDRISFLLTGSIASACCASSTWIGPKNPAHSPMLARVRNATQRAGGLSSGSASAEGTSTGSGGSVLTGSLWWVVRLREAYLPP